MRAHRQSNQRGTLINDSASSLNAPVAASLSSARPEIRRLRIEFTGSGSEYFRIWLVNLLWTLLSLGIYYPWAKVRRMRYFYSNTLVGGEPLDFHADPKKMLKGYLLVGLFFFLYSVAGKFSQTSGFVTFLIGMAIWPALLRSSMQFRLVNTSWRGLRFCFKGSLGDVYRAALPLFVPGAVVLGAFALVADPNKPPMWYVFTVGGVMLGMSVLAPWLLWNLKQYQHNHYALASLQTTFKATLGSFYKLHLKTSGVALLAVLLCAALVGAMFFIFVGSASAAPRKGGAQAAAAISIALSAFAGVAAVLVVIKPYLTSRLQNLVWTRTGNTSMRFFSTLKFRSLLWLTVKNWLLVIVTLGLYWPFAAVALARLRLQSASVSTSVDPDILVAQLRGNEGEAAGDAAGDLLGIDIGL